MTWALCHGCGGTKFGAIVPCPECHLDSTGNFEMDVRFSDHHISHRTINEFGAVLKKFMLRQTLLASAITHS